MEVWTSWQLVPVVVATKTNKTQINKYSSTQGDAQDARASTLPPPPCWKSACLIRKLSGSNGNIAQNNNIGVISKEVANILYPIRTVLMRIRSQIRIQLKVLMRIRIQNRGGGGGGGRSAKMCIPPGKILGTPLYTFISAPDPNTSVSRPT